MGEKLYSISSAGFLLGAFLNNPKLATNGEYPLNLKRKGNDMEWNDFVTLWQKQLYGIILNLAEQGVQEIDEILISQVLDKYPSVKPVFDEIDYMDKIPTLKNICKAEAINYHYNVVRKYSLLRWYRDKGYNINKFYDLNGDESEQLEKFEQYTIEDIVEYFNGTQITANRLFVKEEDDTERKKAGVGGHKVLDYFAKGGTFGLFFESRYLTTLWEGCSKGQLYIRSGDTSSGKSRSMLGDLACLCVNELWNPYTKQWIKNPNGQNNRGLYIGCEMNIYTEVDPILWGYVADVETSKTRRWNMTEIEKDRVAKAVDICANSQIWLTDMPSFNIAKLEQEIKEHKEKYNIDYVIFDYILISNELAREFADKRGKMGGRSDEALLELSKALKDLAKKYDVAILTGTQVNADIKDYRNRDYQVLRGGKAVADKADGGSISMPITEAEKVLVEDYVTKYNATYRQGKEPLYPNFVETVYKLRFSEFPKECKIFSYYNLGTMRKIEMFCTDKEFEPIDIPLAKREGEK